ncbi:MAG TPA: DNA polymerase I [Candidatus Acidoferrales bacterium]|nr:DNA polymerase I [Candidatus Acidoferrales bacterium]
MAVETAQAKLMLLDTYGLVYRAFFALPALTTTRGVPINAAYGFTQMLTKIIGDEKPTHVIAAFDKGLPHKRIEQFAQYKAHRETMPDDLRSQFALVRRILDAYAIPIVEVEGEEADDVIATLAAKATAQGAHVDIVTGDLDLLQLVDEQTTVLATRRGISDLARYDPAAVRARFDLEPGQLADYRGLKGDPSDNLPGIPGIGEKTAIKLLKSAGSLDALLADPSRAGSPKLEALVRDYGETARLCRDVSIVSRDLAVDVVWEAAAFTPPASETLYVLYRDLEFKTLLSRLEMPASQPLLLAEEKELSGSYLSFTAATDPPDFVRLSNLVAEAAMAASPAIAILDGVLGVSASVGNGFSFSLEALRYEPLRAALRRLLLAPSLRAHDAKGVFAALRRHEVSAESLADDTMVLAHLLNPARSYARLGDAVSEYLEQSLPAEAAAHADAVMQLTPVLRDRLAHRGQLALYEELELPLVTILAAMEATGIAVDLTQLTALAREVDAAVTRLQDEIYDLASETFNIGSPQQLGTILFERLRIPGGARNKTGWATGAEVLQSLARDYPICAKVLEYREVTKLKNTYIDVIPQLTDADGRLRTIFNQTSTATGRLSSTNPNLQNIPVRGELGRRIRRAFVAPSAARLLVAADYSQIELRIMAHLSGDEAMRAAFTRGDDIHDVTARGIFHLADDRTATPNQRRIAKSVNFGLLYGMSDFGLAQRLEISRDEARAMTEAYFARFPSVRDYIARNLEFGREHGYVETLLGRRRCFPDLRARNYAMRSAAEREATNAPMQGSAADLMKLAMVRVDRALRAGGFDALLLLQIHDELVLEVERSQLDPVARLLKQEMEHAVALSVPLGVTIKTGATWYDLESLALDDVA